MNIKKEGKDLLEIHKALLEKLEKIPETREILYREEIIDGKLIGKPRFKDRVYQWDKDLLIEFHNHLQNIWNFFEKYSYWFDISIKDIIIYEKRHISKKSLYFLLENDIWHTDEVYGDYLIEESDDHSIISHYRFEHKLQEFKLKKLDFIERENWIKNNAIEQVRTQLNYLWNKIENEIYACMEEGSQKTPIYQLPDQYIVKELEKCLKILKLSDEAALLSLGRLQELWLLKSLNRISSDRNTDLIALVKTQGILEKSKIRFFRKIRNNYNKLKHWVNYDIKNFNVEEYIKRFSHFLITNNP